MSTIREEDEVALHNDAVLGEFFDFGNATAPETHVDDQPHAWVSGYSTPSLSAEHSHHDENSGSKVTHNTTIADQNEDDSPDYTKFSDWIPRYVQPDEACDYCRSRQLQCYMSWGKLTCTACDTLWRQCSFVHVNADSQDPDRRDSTQLNLGLVDTLHSVTEDACQEKGALTGVRPLRSKGGATASSRPEDSSKKSSTRFSRASIKLLRQWLDAHSNNPYPTEDEKAELCTLTGLRHAQINTWLANARRRGKAKANSAGNLSPSLQPSTPAIGIPSSANINVTSWENMNPLDRWKHSPPQNEPAPLTAIADAIDAGYLPPHSDANTPSTLGYRGLGSGLESSRNSSSNRRAPSITSLEQSTSISYSAGSSAAWSGSHESYGSFSSFGSGLNGKKDRRRHRKVSQASAKLRKDDAKKRIFQCTFCTDTFKSKYDWTRHEKSLHISLEKFICCPLGPQVTDPNTGVQVCAYCLDPEPTPEHLEKHGHQQCNEKSKDSRTFYRKDHLRQHVRLVHDSKLLPHMDAWRVEAKFVNSRCGFCGERFTVWQERVDHLAAHFKDGLKMQSWKGCRGLDPEVAATVSSAMPPYLIGVETFSLDPFSATQNTMSTSAIKAKHIEAGGSSKATCWEILTVRLGRFCKEQSDKGVVLTDEAIQRQARIILYDSDDPWEQTAADNPEWLDLFKKAHGLDYIPTTIGGQGKCVPSDLEWYQDLGIRIPFNVQLQHSGHSMPPPIGAEVAPHQKDAVEQSGQPEPSVTCPKSYVGYSTVTLLPERAALFETMTSPCAGPAVSGQPLDASPSGSDPCSASNTQQGQCPPAGATTSAAESLLESNGYYTQRDIMCGLGMNPQTAMMYGPGLAGKTVPMIIDPSNVRYTHESFPNPTPESFSLANAAAGADEMMTDVQMADLNFDEVFNMMGFF
ncbi:hypothetical protein MBLNU459_g4592t1 [Dothideomycetes sp. NU459]